MAKKFGKVLLFTAAIGTAAATACYYLLRKKEVEDFEDDFDFEDCEADESPERNYVPLTPNAEEKKEADEQASESSTFTPLTDVVKKTEAAAAHGEETVEEFFDDDEDFDELTDLDEDDEPTDEGK